MNRFTRRRSTALAANETTAMFGDLYYGTIQNVGITMLARHLRQGALVLCYHNVVPRSDHDEPARYGDPGLHLPLDLFTAQIHWLKDHYQVVPLPELVNRLASGRSVRGLATLTFDDGYSGTFTLAWPLLQRLGLPATMFIVAGAPGRRTPFWWDHPAVVGADSAGARNRRLLSLCGDAEPVLKDARAGAIADVPATHLPADWSVITQAASSGLDLGAHTISHRTVTKLGDADLSHELVDSGNMIEERTGVRPVAFSYPYGIWDIRVRDAVRRAGYRSAVTLDYGLNTSGINLCALRRINVPASISLRAFAGWTAGMRPRRASAA
jgi:peptidoglycan/xylan/chitin deacetylase (PgdA/CDA1 family)